MVGRVADDEVELHGLVSFHSVQVAGLPLHAEATGADGGILGGRGEEVALQVGLRLGRRRAGEAIHLPEVPRKGLGDGGEGFGRGVVAPAAAVGLLEGEEQVASRQKETVALVFIAIGGGEGPPRPLRPRRTVKRVRQSAQLAVQKTVAVRPGDGLAGVHVVTRREVGGLTAGDLQPAEADVGLPVQALAERGGRLRRVRRALAEPRGVGQVGHPAANPGRGEDLAVGTDAGLAFLEGLRGAGAEQAGGDGLAHARRRHGVPAAKALAQCGDAVRDPADGPRQRAVGEQHLQQRVSPPPQRRLQGFLEIRGHNPSCLLSHVRGSIAQSPRPPKVGKTQGIGTVARPEGPNGEAPRPLRPFASSRRKGARETLRGRRRNPKGFDPKP